MKHIVVILLLPLLILGISICIQVWYADVIINAPSLYVVKNWLSSLYSLVGNISSLPKDNNNEPLEHRKTDEILRETLFTPEALATYNGKEGSQGLYLSLLGNVFDVEKGHKFYGPGGGYEFFAGRDASRAYVTGDFSEKGLIDDVSGLSPQDYLGLSDWVKFYANEYKPVGKLIGRYFDENGEGTSYKWKVEGWILEAQEQKDNEAKEKLYFPPCNTEWSPEKGSRVYCTKKSGGVERDWIGVPRRLVKMMSEEKAGSSSPQGKTKLKERCACVKNFGPPVAPAGGDASSSHENRGDLDHPNLREYESCDSREASCHIKEK